jgi:hypothetical protein
MPGKPTKKAEMRDYLAQVPPSAGQGVQSTPHE